MRIRQIGLKITDDGTRTKKQDPVVFLLSG